jgi:hypothetical protein
LPRLALPAPAAALAALAVLLLAAVPAQSSDPVPDPRPALFRVGPDLHGVVVASCPGSSPLRNACEAWVPRDACGDGCWPSLAPALGFTGRLTATVWGKASDQRSDRYVALSCPYAANSQLNAAGAGTGHCTAWWSAETFCDARGCYQVLWPPFLLKGEASPLAAAPVGSWSVRVEATG